MLRSVAPRVALLVLLAATAAGGRENVPPPPPHVSQLVRTHWTAASGLPSASCSEAVQGSDGTLWVGTMEGLAAFDGGRFEVFDSSNVRGLKGSEISRLVSGSTGSLFAGTPRSGLLVRRDGVFTVVGGAAGASWPLLPWPGGGVLVGFGGRLAVVSETGAEETLAQVVPEDVVLASAGIDGEGRIWVAESRGRLFVLTRRDGGWKVDEPTAWAAKRQGPLEILVRRDGTVLAAGREGLLSVTVEVVRSVEHPGLRGRWVIPRLEDRRGDLWVVRDGRELCRLGANGALSCIELEGSRNVQRVSQDRDGAIWVTTWDAGLLRLEEGVLEPWGPAEGSGRRANAVLEGPDGTLWAGTRDGLFGIREGRARRHEALTRVDPERVMSLALGRDGGLLVGTWKGLHVVDLAKGEVRRPFVLRGAVFAVLVDRGGTVWASVDGRVVRLGPGGGEEVDGLGGATYVLAEDSAGRLWAGGVKGLREIVGMKEVPRAVATPKPLDVVFSFFEPRPGRLLVGMLEGGLNVLERGRVRRLGRADGLPSDSILGMLSDETSLFLATPRGLARVGLASLDSRLSGGGEPLAGEVFGPADGLGAPEMGGSGQPTAVGMRDGRLVFATNAGLAVLDPARLAARRLDPPPARVERVVVDGRPVGAGAGLALPPGRHRVEIGFGAVQLAHRERLGFRFRLEGVDEGWVTAGSRLAAEYPALGHGRRRFTVEATLDGTRWGSAGALEVAIESFLWERTSARVGAVLALIALALAGHLTRVARLSREEREMAALAELGRSVAGILDPAEVLRLLDGALEAQLGATWRLVVARREGRPAVVHEGGRANRRLDRAALMAVLEARGAAAVASSPRRLTGAGASDPLGRLLSASGATALVPLGDGRSAVGFVALALRSADSRTLARASGFTSQAALALEGAFQAQEAVRWQRVSEARRDWLRLDLLARLAFATVARSGKESGVTEEAAVATLAEALAGTGLDEGERLRAAIGRLVAEGLVEPRPGGLLEPVRDELLLLPELRLPLADLARQTATRVGAYEIVERIGAGGMAEVFRARNAHDGSPAAVKLLYPHETADAEARRRLDREGRLVSEVRHPNVVRLLERGEHDGRLYLAMELLKGRTLSAALRADGPFAEAEVLRAARELGGALAALHAAGVVHRDVNTNNVMLEPDGRFVLLDLGLAKGIGASTLTRERTIVGTLPYMSPEQLRGAEAGPASDLWSLGVVLWEMATGLIPWESSETVRMALEILGTGEGRSRLAAERLPAAVRDLVGRLLDPEAGRRALAAG